MTLTAPRGIISYCVQTQSQTKFAIPSPQRVWDLNVHQTTRLDKRKKVLISDSSLSSTDSLFRLFHVIIRTFSTSFRPKMKNAQIVKTEVPREAWWEKKLKIMPEATKFKNGGIDPELENKLDWMFQGINDDATFSLTFGLQSIDGTDDDEPPKLEGGEVVIAVEEIQMPKKAMCEHLNEIDNHCMEQNPLAHSESEHQSEPPNQKKRSPESDSSHLNKDDPHYARNLNDRWYLI
ncbi:hypothetical protein V6N13_147888 [Hibiscus sabdariffa]